MKCKKILSLLIFLSIIGSVSINTYASDNLNVPEPIKVVDFSNSFEELEAIDNNFEVVDNAAKPELVEDEVMGQVLKLNKAIIKDQEYYENDDIKYFYIVSDNSEYSTINISNPYAGVDHLVEYEPYEDVVTTKYRNCTQPLWKEGITISYWIKTPSGENGYGINSNVLGFTSERFQIQSQDYALHMCTIKYDVEYNQLTDEERKLFGSAVEKAGVLPTSDFYFELASDELYNNSPIYKAPDDQKMGRNYWMNKYYIEGYYLAEDGTYKDASDGNSARYADYKVAPELGNSPDDHNPGTSNMRYAWTYSEMWLDASSSFYFTNDEKINTQLNPNSEEDYLKVMGMQHYNSFNINSWRCFDGSYYSYDKADYYNDAAKSPVIEPDEWHYVTVVIQNDWVKYYFDGKEIDIEEKYSSYGLNGLAKILGSYQPWKKFNKGTGSRYGYGTNKSSTYWCYYGNYCSPTIMEWITLDCVNLSIGGGNRNGDAYFMYADTDEIYLKNIVFYDVMLTNEQIESLAEYPNYYRDYIKTTADVNDDGKVTPRDALLILKHAAQLETLEIPLTYDLTHDGITDTEDALKILKYTVGLIELFN